jgi:hypothetical protein
VHYYDLTTTYTLNNTEQFEHDLKEAQNEILKIQESQLQLG